MQEQPRVQQPLVNLYRTADRVVVAAPLPGMEPDNIVVEVTANGRLILHGELRGMLTGQKDVLVEEWTAGPYHRELDLPAPVDAELANVTYGNGILVVVLPVAPQSCPARLVMQALSPVQGERVGNAGRFELFEPLTTEEHWQQKGGPS
jgi:HSP20 family protein